LPCAHRVSDYLAKKATYRFDWKNPRYGLNIRSKVTF
jgi:hypothetical protein